jgi:hypothetical protein
VSYGSDIVKLVEKQADGSTKAFPALRGGKTISSFGGFAKVRAGYRWVSVVGSMAAYWPDYGDFQLFGGKSEHLRGWTYVPALAPDFRF